MLLMIDKGEKLVVVKENIARGMLRNLPRSAARHNCSLFTLQIQPSSRLFAFQDQFFIGQYFALHSLHFTAAFGFFRINLPLLLKVSKITTCFSCCRRAVLILRWWLAGKNAISSRRLRLLAVHWCLLRLFSYDREYFKRPLLEDEDN